MADISEAAEIRTRALNAAVNYAGTRSEQFTDIQVGQIAERFRQFIQDGQIQEPASG